MFNKHLTGSKPYGILRVSQGKGRKNEEKILPEREKNFLL